MHKRSILAANGNLYLTNLKVQLHISLDDLKAVFDHSNNTYDEFNCEEWKEAKF